MAKVDQKIKSRKHNHKKAHDTNTSRNRKLIRDIKRGYHS